MNDHRITPELAARATAAQAAARDFRTETDRYLAIKGAEPNWSDWAFRLAAELTSLLDGLDAAATGAGSAQPGGGWMSGPSTSPSP